MRAEASLFKKDLREAMDFLNASPALLRERSKWRDLRLFVLRKL
jgi:hypothetical protein